MTPDQERQLRAENARLQQELTQRHIDDATSAIRGIEVLVALAAAGNVPARVALKTLYDVLEAGKTAMVGLVIAKS